MTGSKQVPPICDLCEKPKFEYESATSIIKCGLNPSHAYGNRIAGELCPTCEALNMKNKNGTPSLLTAKFVTKKEWVCDTKGCKRNPLSKEEIC